MKIDLDIGPELAEFLRSEGGADFLRALLIVAHSDPSILEQARKLHSYAKAKNPSQAGRQGKAKEPIH